jgi:hypothetical protein
LVHLFGDKLSIGDVGGEVDVVVGAFEIGEGDSHFDPWVTCAHPEEFWCQLLDFVAENDRHSKMG